MIRFFVFLSVMLRFPFWGEMKTMGYTDALGNKGRQAKNSCAYQDGYVLGLKHRRKYLND
jgi:hypothetical protein